MTQVEEDLFRSKHCVIKILQELWQILSTPTYYAELLTNRTDMSLSQISSYNKGYPYTQLIT